MTVSAGENTPQWMASQAGNAGSPRARYGVPAPAGRESAIPDDIGRESPLENTANQAKNGTIAPYVAAGT